MKTKSPLPVQAIETNRPRLESLILIRLRELKGIEIGLHRQFPRLASASSTVRASFLQKLGDLERRAQGLEGLIDTIDTLDDQARRPLSGV